MGNGSIAGAIGGNTHYGGLYKVVETAEEESEHPTWPHDPNSGVWELVLED